MKNLNNVVLILSDARGVYIPRDFVTDDYNELAEEHCAAWGMDEINRGSFEGCINPDDEWYWDNWQYVLDNARYTEKETGKVFTLYQDGDLWAICYDYMTEEERQNFGFDE